MFTGIVTDLGTVVSAEQRGDLRVRVRTGYDPATITLGASIACSGVCLTVVDRGDDWFAVDVSAETRSRTAPQHWQDGASLNLERALRLGDEFGGHIVTGHVDALAQVVDVTADGDSRRLRLVLPAEYGPMVAVKGSITLDGVSLTINDVRDSPSGTEFTVNIIPHTAQHTTLGRAAVGQHLNVEVDVIARYLQRMTSARSQ